MRLRVLLDPGTVLVSEALVPLTSTLPSFIHTTSGTTTSPSTTFTVHTSEYTDPAIEMPGDAVTTGGGRAVKIGMGTCYQLVMVYIWSHPPCTINEIFPEKKSEGSM